VSSATPAVHYVYVLFRPDGSPCYVGKGKGDRWRDHRRSGSKHLNKNLARIIANAGMDLPYKKVASELTEALAFELEKFLIQEIGRKKHGGPLTNLTDGGEGISGFVFSEESRAKMAASQTGVFPSEETRRKISIAGKGRKKSADTIEKVAASHRGRKRPPETGRRISAAKKGKPCTPEAMASKIEAMNRPEVREKIRLSRIGKKASAETRAKMSIMRLGKKHPPRSDAARENYRIAALARHARARNEISQ
jgi:hypothetical protein